MLLLLVYVMVPLLHAEGCGHVSCRSAIVITPFAVCAACTTIAVWAVPPVEGYYTSRTQAARRRRRVLILSFVVRLFLVGIDTTVADDGRIFAIQLMIKIRTTKHAVKKAVKDYRVGILHHFDVSLSLLAAPLELAKLEKPCNL